VLCPPAYCVEVMRGGAGRRGLAVRQLHRAASGQARRPGWVLGVPNPAQAAARCPPAPRADILCHAHRPSTQDNALATRGNLVLLLRLRSCVVVSSVCRSCRDFFFFLQHALPIRYSVLSTSGLGAGGPGAGWPHPAPPSSLERPRGIPM
jgi:hypothetical protein